MICGSYSTFVAQGGYQKKLPNNLVQQLIADINSNENNFRLSGEELKVLHKELKFNMHDLNADGVLEYFLYIDHRDWCGAGANCSYWVYQKTANGYKLLVEDKVLRVKETVTNGYRDLSSETPMGFCERNVQRVSATQYKYNGEKYQAEESKYACQPVTSKGS